MTILSLAAFVTENLIDKAGSVVTLRENTLNEIQFLVYGLVVVKPFLQ